MAILRKKENKNYINTRNQKEYITTDPMDVKRIIGELEGATEIHKFDSLGKIDQMLATSAHTRRMGNLSRLIQDISQQ